MLEHAGDDVASDDGSRCDAAMAIDPGRKRRVLIGCPGIQSQHVGGARVISIAKVAIQGNPVYFSGGLALSKGGPVLSFDPLAFRREFGHALVLLGDRAYGVERLADLGPAYRNGAVEVFDYLP